MKAQDSWLGDVFYAGALMFVAAIFVLGAISLAMTSAEDFSSEPEVAKTLFVLQWNGIWLFAPR